MLALKTTSAVVTSVITAAVVITAAAETAQDTVSLIAIRNFIFEVLNLKLLLSRPMAIESIDDALCVILVSTDNITLILLSLESSSSKTAFDRAIDKVLATLKRISLLAHLQRDVTAEIGNLALSRAAAVLNCLNNAAIT